MKGKPEVIATLNRLLADEFTAIHTYVLHSEMCEHWGYDRLAAMIRKDAIQEMRHAEKHMERILYLEGEPDAYTLDRMPVGKSVIELIKTQLGMERAAIAAYNKGVETAQAAGDSGTRDYLEKILKDEEQHELFLQTQLELIEAVGLQNYLAEQINGSD